MDDTSSINSLSGDGTDSDDSFVSSLLRLSLSEEDMDTREMAAQEDQEAPLEMTWDSIVSFSEMEFSVLSTLQKWQNFDETPSL